jgi:hypothetical protein
MSAKKNSMASELKYQRRNKKLSKRINNLKKSLSVSSKIEVNLHYLSRPTESGVIEVVSKSAG